MCKLFIDNEAIIQEYCNKNHLNFEKAKKSPKSFSKDDIYILHYDEDKAVKQLSGLIPESPMPVVLKIYKRKNNLEFEQTEHTKKYLSI